MMSTAGQIWIVGMVALLVVALLLAVSWLVSLGVVSHLRRKYKVDGEKAAELHLQAVGSFSTILGGLSVLAAVVGGLYSIQKANEDVKLAREGQLAGRFTDALTALDIAAATPADSVGSSSAGTPRMPTKPLGGIVALEAIVAAAPEYREPAARVLSSFIRASSQRRRTTGTCRWLDEWLAAPSAGAAPPTPRLLPDLHPSLEPHLLEAFKTLGRLRPSVDLTLPLVPEQVDIKEAIDISSSDMCIAYAKRASFDYGWFRNADLRGAVLDGSSFRCSGFREVMLDGAHLIDVQFDYADLRRANFGRAEVTGIDLTGANLAGADLSLVEYSSERGGLATALARACGNTESKLPHGIEMPRTWMDRPAPLQENFCNGDRDRACASSGP